MNILNLEHISKIFGDKVPDVIYNINVFQQYYLSNNNVTLNGEAFRVNAIGARNLASASRKVNAKMVQISTDDIFMGNNDKTLTEFDTPTPVSVYGKTVQIGTKCGADLIFIETMNDSYDTKAALLAAKEADILKV